MKTFDVGKKIITRVESENVLGSLFLPVTESAERNFK
jgi:hypothetical protein